MDLVKLSAAGGMAVFAALALASTGGATGAEPTAFGGPAEMPEPSIQARIDAAFRDDEPSPFFALSGPVLPHEVGAVPVLPAATGSALPSLSFTVTANWAPLIDEAARRFGIPPEWVHGVMQVESGGRTMMNGRPVTSSAGAMGLMQVMPATFAELSARYGLGSDPYEPRANIMAGAAYLREMYDRYGAAHFLSAYNAGPARVGAHLRTGRPLPLETRRYNAMLLPRLVPGAVGQLAALPSHAQDLTAPEALRALAFPPSRVSVQRRQDPAQAPVFVTTNAASPAPARQPNAQPNNGLFVTLTRTDRRQEVAAAEAHED